MKDKDQIVEMLTAIRGELTHVRRAQHKLTKVLFDLRHELNHRIGTTKEDVEALIKASHNELSDRLDRMGSSAEDFRTRLDDIEQDFDQLFDVRG
ncbi:MAG: hypothetical protein AUK47_23540 [Deltaproteobacteria bacterium CG2_30_63_29]|nr:MAG: hypothetical protein AUK47_23540 [Deltaproteobacteria bacterium CG2_30_63_29]PIW01086.1 MAG: hypothetical protein COW42_05970 [Deltaproteobacteria bacterium CG17_big_fil_post_rev_8_21_14_2_50_63_7]PJB43914.1 MAG: hypothetical protein CO108_09530 [Deltaproteobacteria bacterium CG_4_9_14_3_um_filter_63_12]